MIRADVKYGESYEWAMGLGFRSVQHVIDHVREPWNYPPLYEPDPGYDPTEHDGLPDPGFVDFHPRSYYPTHGDWQPYSIVAFVWVNVPWDAPMADLVIEAGKRGGLKRVPL